MKRMLFTALAAAALTGLMAPPAARAVDHKMYHGSDCKVFGATAWTDLSFSGFGVKNLASSARNIICPIIKDTEALWDGDAVTPTNYSFAGLRLQTGSVAASYACTVYVTSLENTTSVRSYAITSGGVVAPNTLTYYSTLTAGPFNSADNVAGFKDRAYILCTLGPQVRLLGYYVEENATTD